ncbi:MAG: DUF1854 domain-containing protein [Defluviitaleaceae bacterium]|nr:DUF1854 domain-containing protein [Defluviitaleaceae bacterium]
MQNATTQKDADDKIGGSFIMEELNADIGLLDVGKAEFFLTEGGFTGLRYDGKEHKHVTLRRALPVNQPSEYISVADNENKEIGILRSLSELSESQLPIVVKELDNRYYSPEVLEVISVKDKLGYVYMELRIKNKSEQSHLKNCAVKDVSRNIRMLNETSMIIFDVDGNRYIVRDINKMDKLSLRRLDPYLF